MPDWKQTLDISDLWNASILRGGTLTPQDIAKGVAARLEKIPSDDYFDLDDIKEQFIGLSEDADADFNDLDYVYSALCDYGDINHQLWIKTF